MPEQMVKTPLERAARALVAELFRQDGDDVEPEAIEFGANLEIQYIDQNCVSIGSLVRAVLLAIREPSEAMVEAVRDAVPHFISAETAKRVAQAMIDTALEEG